MRQVQRLISTEPTGASPAILEPVWALLGFSVHELILEEETDGYATGGA